MPARLRIEDAEGIVFRLPGLARKRLAEIEAGGGSIQFERKRSLWWARATANDGIELGAGLGATQVAALKSLVRMVDLRLRLGHHMISARPGRLVEDELRHLLPEGHTWKASRSGDRWKAISIGRNSPGGVLAYGETRDRALEALASGIRDARLQSKVGEEPWHPDLREDFRNSPVWEWWGSTHDALIPAAIARDRWYWDWSMTEAVRSITDTKVFEPWKAAHRRMGGTGTVWYNHISRFAVARAAELDYLRLIPRPVTKPCIFCGHDFVEDSIWVSLADDFGMDALVACSLCIGDFHFLGIGNANATKPDITSYAQSLTAALGRIPPAVIHKDDLRALPVDQRIAVIKALHEMPTSAAVKRQYGSWLAALIDAGVLDKNARETARGTQSIASDGHVCFSLGERTIDDLLTRLAIPHSREERYPESGYRSDFTVGRYHIEYLGLAGDPAYDEKTKRKEEVALHHGMSLVLLRAEDLLDPERLGTRLRALAPSDALT